MNKRLCPIILSEAVALSFVMFLWASAAFAATSTTQSQIKATPTPADPYPMNAAGWGPSAGKDRMASRWAEDWTILPQAAQAPPFKAMPLWTGGFLTLSAEARLRYDAYDNGQLKIGNDYSQGLFRGILGADLRFNSNFRLYGEIGTGQVVGLRDTAAANLQNDTSVQQLFFDARWYLGSFLVGAMVGCQEFADGPKPLISLGDGSNLHRTWNGGRFYAHDQNFRLGAFFLMATQLGRGFFEEGINDAERLEGLNASLILLAGPKGANLYLDPFWIHSENPAFPSGGSTGFDDRDSYGARFWGKRGSLSLDWTLARQSGQFLDRPIDAWGFFTVQSLELLKEGWRPRLGLHVDIASGGGYGTGTLGFNQLYAASAYLSEGLFLSTSNLLLISSVITVSPMTGAELSVEYGFADRLREDDAAYGGKMKAYPGTQNVPGFEIGGLLRIAGSWKATEHLSFFFTYEHLVAGDVLQQAGVPSGSYGYVGTTLRY